MKNLMMQQGPQANLDQEAHDEMMAKITDAQQTAMVKGLTALARSKVPADPAKGDELLRNLFGIRPLPIAQEPATPHKPKD